MNIHIKTDVISIRVYADSCGYHNKDKYSAIITGYVLSDTEIFLANAHGKIELNAIKQIHAKLKEMGFESVSMVRHSKMYNRKL